jgi:ATP-dependent Clp protease ATP-binding subunit ClpC
MNAYVIIGVVIALGGVIFAANNASHFLSMAIFVASCGGIAGITITERRKLSSAPSHKVDYTRLNMINILAYKNWIKENVRGHDAVIDSIVSSLQEELALARKGRILGAYLLVGPTGTGKTFLSTLMAQALFPHSEPIILRMNQLKHADDVFTLIGAPPGRAGYEIGGALTRPVLENPYRVVVFDEIERCHPHIHDCLYDILDAGQCREKSSGKTVDFSGCVFFATSNAGVEELRGVFEGTRDFNQRVTQSRDALVASVGFDKAFLARWTRIEFMDTLDPIHVAEVALIQLCQYWKEYGMEVSYVPPEMLLEAVDRNEEFRNYGVRQLSTYIRTTTNQAISQAKQANVKRVMLDVSAEGNVIVRSRS